MTTTKKMEEFFNLPPADIEEIERLEEIIPAKSRDELMHEAREIYSSLTTAEKIDHALPTVVGLDTHDSDMDDIAQKAVNTFQDLVNLGSNVPDMHAGKIFEVAGQMLKTAMEAKNAKAEKKLRMLELQMKKARLEQIDIEKGITNATNGKTGDFDRNELLRYMIESKPEDSDK